MTVGVWTIAVVATVFLLREASDLFIPIVLAFLISYALEPIVAWLKANGVPRLVGASAILAAVVGMAGVGVYTLRDDTTQAFEALPEAARRARDFVWAQGGSAAQQVQQAAEELQSVPSSSGQDDRTVRARSAPAQGESDTALSQWVQQGVGSVLALAGHIAVIFFLVFFLLLSGEHVRRRTIEVIGMWLGVRRAATIVQDIDTQIQRFLLVQAMTAAVVAAATWAALAWLGVAQAPVWAILAGVFNSIPYFGPVMVSGGLFVIGLLQSGDVTEGLTISGAALAITSLEGWILTPALLGRAERMHALVIFLGLLVWTWIWGPWGTVLAVPMLVVVKSVADHVEALAPLSRLMAP